MGSKKKALGLQQPDEFCGVQPSYSIGHNDDQQQGLCVRKVGILVPAHFLTFSTISVKPRPLGQSNERPLLRSNNPKQTNCFRPFPAIHGIRRMSAPVKVFGCRPFTADCRHAGTEPAFENLQKEGNRESKGRRCRRRDYGDLRTASGCFRAVGTAIEDGLDGWRVTRERLPLASRSGLARRRRSREVCGAALSNGALSRRHWACRQ